VAALLTVCEIFSSVEAKVIVRIISVGSSLLEATTSAIYFKGNNPKIQVNRGGVAVLNRKPAISLKRGKIDQCYY